MPTAIYFDMDGTIADLYGFEGWLDCLTREDVEPYSACAPLFDARLIGALSTAREVGVHVGVISWGAMHSSAGYLARTRDAKAAWLDAHGFPYDELHVVGYGTDKAACAHVKRGSVLVDDDERVRESWETGEGRTAVEPGRCLDFINGLLKSLRHDA